MLKGVPGEIHPGGQRAGPDHRRRLPAVRHLSGQLPAKRQNPYQQPGSGEGNAGLRGKGGGFPGAVVFRLFLSGKAGPDGRGVKEAGLLRGFRNRPGRGLRHRPVSRPDGGKQDEEHHHHLLPLYQPSDRAVSSGGCGIYGPGGVSHDCQRQAD